ncbi:hypothetical protein [Streptomyces boncukensis]|uniref:Uncharacterized protein n=1 Tax=Streptomyces boncukensis TaxID=2711219 RepID=A0A6G4X8B0_9ACTN|nr:hypothetical protein [Streptomyces boncukensis]NGO73382.1 hypothetical protein [Streptomyces boncukensis]
MSAAMKLAAALADLDAEGTAERTAEGMAGPAVPRCACHDEDPDEPAASAARSV